MDKYIIDGVEYSNGEEVEVRDFIDSDWEKDVLFGIQSNMLFKFICRSANWKYIRKLQPKPLSGRKAKLILDDGTEYSVVVE